MILKEKERKERFRWERVTFLLKRGKEYVYC